MMPKNDHYELVKNPGRKDEEIICTSKDRYYLSELRHKYWLEDRKTKFEIRPEVVKIKG